MGFLKKLHQAAKNGIKKGIKKAKEKNEKIKAEAKAKARASKEAAWKGKPVKPVSTQPATTAKPVAVTPK